MTAAALVVTGGSLVGLSIVRAPSLPGYAGVGGSYEALQQRFDRDRAHFDAWAADIAADPAQVCTPKRSEQWAGLAVPSSIGSYRIGDASCAPNAALILWEPSGSFFNDAGFAYLPAGPSPELSTGWFEAPEFHALGGDWYSFVASW